MVPRILDILVTEELAKIFLGSCWNIETLGADVIDVDTGDDTVEEDVKEILGLDTDLAWLGGLAKTGMEGMRISSEMLAADFLVTVELALELGKGFDNGEL